MRDIIELNAEIEGITNPEIEFHQEFKNIRFYGKWINEIDYNYFHEWEEKIKNKINCIIDLDSSSKTKFAKVFQQDVLLKYKDLLKIDYDNFDILQSTSKFIYLSNRGIETPKSKFQDIYFTPEDSSGFEEIMFKMAEVYKVEGFDLYDVSHGPDSHKDILQDEILDKLDLEADELEMLYAYAHLALVLESTRKMLERITKFLDYLVSLIKKLENFEEDKLNLDEIYDNDWIGRTK